MKAYDLLKKAKESPKEVEGKMYAVKKGAVITITGKEVDEVYVSSGELLSKQAKGLRLYISETTMLEEIQEPVPFLEAVKAYAEGKTIRCENIDGTILTYDHKRMFPNDMVDRGGRAVNSHEILNCKWFIEND